MLGSDHHVRCPKQRIGPSRVNPQYLVGRLARKTGLAAMLFPGVEFFSNIEVDFGAGAAANPVVLQFLDAFGPVDVLQVIFQPICVGRDSQHPLPQRHSLHRMSTDLGQAIDDFFVGQYRSQAGHQLTGAYD